MLRLSGIVKDYIIDSNTVHALKGIDLEFRKSEFVSVFGPSGCGKTTLLNIIGGLDRYTSGDLAINGRSTKEYRDGDWDTYRNRSVGFVFQTYNLIPHQTVLGNVELALTLSGVSKSERRRRAADVLDKVGLGDQLTKKPNQLSGGQMQRVAIARALVNNPDILLADEPTGALDSETSVQIMEILKEIAQDRLVIMVTHNPDLANRYSTRIVRLLDGRVTDDTNPFHSEPVPSANQKKKRRKGAHRTPMSFLTALSLSLNNLMTKKTRTLLTAFAGSIGIIGIALILSLSSGFQSYINKVEEDTLSSYPITIEQESVDMTAMLQTIAEDGDTDIAHELDQVYSNNVMGKMMNTMFAQSQRNDLTSFKVYLEEREDDLSDLVTGITCGYDMELSIYQPDVSDGITQVNPSTVFDDMGTSSLPGFSSPMASYDVWTEMLDNQPFLESQYDVLAGRWPDAFNEAVLIVDENNEISDFVLYSLGLMDQSEVSGLMDRIMDGEEIDTETMRYSYDDLLHLTYKLVLPSDLYEKSGDAWTDMSEDEDFMKNLIGSAVDLKIVGIIRPGENSVATSVSGAVGYTKALTDYVIDETKSSAIVQEQQETPDVDVFTGTPFSSGGGTSGADFDISSLSEEEQRTFAELSDAEKAAFIEQYTSSQNDVSDSTYETNLRKLGVVDKDEPSSINIYAASFEAKESVAAFIQDYNDQVTEDGREDLTITYTDYVQLLMSSVSTIINIISYVLIAFVAISLVVSSIMIGIITYISVLERTKEIGILRSIGASKKDISRVFNAETMIIGFVSGALGIILTLILLIPANLIISNLTGAANLAALPVSGGLLLVLISMILTLIAGLIPSRFAAKKDPVTALRTE